MVLCAKHCAKCFTYGIELNYHNRLDKVGTIIITPFYIRNWFRDVMCVQIVKSRSGRLKACTYYCCFGMFG